MQFTIQELAKNKLSDLERKDSFNIKNLTNEGSWSFCNSIKDSALNSDAILILTEWN